MLPQELAVQKICASLKTDPFVRAVYLKGSMGRNEHDEHSDVDLYCLVDEENEKHFMDNRLHHLQAYRPVIFKDDIFIIAPQIIAVFDNLLHIDLFTVTPEKFTEKDYFKVLYDPDNVMERFVATQSLELDESEFRDDVIDVAWFLFQYQKAAARGNGIWAVKMLSSVMDHLARVLLYKYAPERARLGLKAISKALPAVVLLKTENIFNQMTASRHAEAASQISKLVEEEIEWILARVAERDQIETLLRKMVEIHTRQETKRSL
ncbi:aminoglycoside 6-adenylyltransferase [Planococcus shenhongbingii]|uniref:Aminoglycoside 6-adenylyltransferase n=1 Tax=Planococcus shenhongbingii TaxID=3058398 RepID=A0ABT8NET3_9BACL|nr:MULTISPECIES: aminoglycoside 6-adenylyltransferase [unclassified Planococcus (in: firmicutes)]MDN7246005.1 aminoglycoside 6-adenylyltransferase [Planococcus sp. N017]WKA59865.1 aminoglycoside 6-adenylyltransferase [Planococcus sp. N016]